MLRNCIICVLFFYIFFALFKYMGIRVYSQQCEHMHQINIGVNKQMRAKGELVWLGDGWHWLPINASTPTTTMEAHVDMFITHDIVWRLEISDEVHMRACAWVISVALCVDRLPCDWNVWLETISRGDGSR